MTPDAPKRAQAARETGARLRSERDSSAGNIGAS